MPYAVTPFFLAKKDTASHMDTKQNPRYPFLAGLVSNRQNQMDCNYGRRNLSGFFSIHVIITMTSKFINFSAQAMCWLLKSTKKTNSSLSPYQILKNRVPDVGVRKITRRSQAALDPNWSSAPINRPSGPLRKADRDSSEPARTPCQKDTLK